MTVRYDDEGKPVEIEKVLISTQHQDGVESKLPEALWEEVVTAGRCPPTCTTRTACKEEFYVNPTGRFVIGGPVGDTGLTGRKIIVDTYGGFARHGGGAFSGKDPSKVDRSAAYAARYVAKNIVAAGLADRAEVQVAYAIGVARPLSLLIETFGTEKISRKAIVELVTGELRPAPRRDPARPGPAPPRLPADRRLRPLRPHRRRLHLGAHRQGRPAPHPGGSGLERGADARLTSARLKSCPAALKRGRARAIGRTVFPGCDS